MRGLVIALVLLAGCAMSPADRQMQYQLYQQQVQMQAAQRPVTLQPTATTHCYSLGDGMVQCSTY